VKDRVFASDEELIEGCIRSDEKAWSGFVHRFSSLIRYSIKKKMLSFLPVVSDDDIDDIFQQIFDHILSKERLRELKKPGSIGAYLTIISQHITIDFLRKRKAYFNIDSPNILCDSSLIVDSTPRSESHRNELNQIVNNFIENLSQKENRIVALEVFYGLKHREIAAIMNMPQNTVSTVIARAKARLKEILQDKGYYEK